MLINVLNVNIIMNKYKVKSRQLTTWNTKVCLPCFPYGSSPWPPIGSFILTELPSIAFTVQLLIQNHQGLATITIILQIIITLSMIKILLTNPGILPQIVNRYEIDQDLFALPSKQVQEQHRYLITQHNMLHIQKFCQQCQIYRPIRTIHCAACNHCVQRYDHHCPWLSVCIGKYNYKYFLVYLIGLVMLSVFCSITGIVFTIDGIKDDHKLVQDYIVYLLVTVFAVLFILPLGRLMFYHFYLIKAGLTTNEDLKKTYEMINNQLPYEKLECGLYRQKRLPKFSYRKKIKLPKIRAQKEQMIALELQFSESTSRSSPLKSQRQSVLNSLLQNQAL